MITRTAPAARALTVTAIGGRPRRLNELVFEQLGPQIVTGQVSQAEVLMSEQTLADRFGVSRSVVREALSKLQDRGLLEVRHGSGVAVAPPDRWDLLDRDVLRWLAAASAAHHAEALDAERGLHDAAAEFARAIVPVAAQLPGNPLFTCLLRRLEEAGYGLRPDDNGDANFEGAH